MMDAAVATLHYTAATNGVSHYEERQSARFHPAIELPPEVSAATNQYADSGFDHHFAKLQLLTKDRSLWPEAACAPAAHTQVWALVMLRLLQFHNFPPTRVVASAEGGIAICFVTRNKYADVEFLNTGEILGVLSNRPDRPVVWEIDQSSRDLTRASVRIREFLDSPSPKANAAKWPWSR